MKDVASFARATNQIVPAYRDAFAQRATIWKFDCGCVLGQRRTSFKSFERGSYDYVDATCGNAAHEFVAREGLD